jgi:hypothetical protein
MADDDHPIIRSIAKEQLAAKDKKPSNNDGKP